MISGILSGPYKNLYNPENVYTSKDGGGAANNWQLGHKSAESIRDELIEMIDREADGSDSLEVSEDSKMALIPVLKFERLKSGREEKKGHERQALIMCFEKSSSPPPGLQCSEIYLKSFV